MTSSSFTTADNVDLIYGSTYNYSGGGIISAGTGFMVLQNSGSAAINTFYGLQKTAGSVAALATNVVSTAQMHCAGFGMQTV